MGSPGAVGAEGDWIRATDISQMGDMREGGEGLPAEAVEELDRLCKDTEESWRATVVKIEELLEE